LKHKTHQSKPNSGLNSPPPLGQDTLSSNPAVVRRSPGAIGPAVGTGRVAHNAGVIGSGIAGPRADQRQSSAPYWDFLPGVNVVNSDGPSLHPRTQSVPSLLLGHDDGSDGHTLGPIMGSATGFGNPLAAGSGAFSNFDLFSAPVDSAAYSSPYSQRTLAFDSTPAPITPPTTNPPLQAAVEPPGGSAPATVVTQSLFGLDGVGFNLLSELGDLRKSGEAYSPRE